MVLSLSLLYEDVLQNLIYSISQTLQSGGVPTPEDAASAARELEYAKQKNMLYAATGILIMAAIFGWLITRLALTPTRDALSSQKQFVGNIAHELRTPLSIIKTNTEVALMDDKLGKDMRETLTSNVEELDRISDIINNLLSMNMLLRPEKIRFENVDLAQTVDRVKSALADLAEHKRIALSASVPERWSVWGNPSGIEQIVMNVAKNAINYTPPGGAVTVSVEPPKDKQIAIVVEDNGVGISEKELARIFEPFYRGDSSRNRRSGGGSGLGLAIVSELVKLHKGRIIIRSAPGRGTVVTVTLPEGRSAGHGNAADPGRDEVAMDFSGKKRR